MVLFKKALVLFGGYHDTAKKSPRYFNDVHIFDLETYRCVFIHGMASTLYSPNIAYSVTYYGTRARDVEERFGQVYWRLLVACEMTAWCGKRCTEGGNPQNSD